MKAHKTWGRRLMSVLLVLSMAVGLLPVAVFAAQETGSDVTAANVAIVESYAQQMRKQNQKTDYSSGGFTWDTEGKSDSWRYFNGVMLMAFLMEGDTEFADAFYDDNIYNDGTIKNYHTGELDSVPTARGLFDLLDSSTHAEKYEKAIQYVYTQLEDQVTYSNCGGNYLHKQDSDGNPTGGWGTWNIGLDGLYMAEPFLMECANAIDAGKLTLTDKVGNAVQSSDIYESVYARFIWVADTMCDSEDTGLYNHGWNVSEGTANGYFWGRGIGWYAMALVDVIAMMPNEGSTREMRAELIKRLPTLFDGMLNYQDAETGMWYNVVDADSSLSKNILETSVSSMMAYALLKAYNEGFVKKDKYGEAGLAAFNGVVANKVTGSEGSYAVKDTYLKSGVGTSNAYYTTQKYTVDEAKGTGALIMAATQANAAAEALNPAPAPDPEPTPDPEPEKPAESLTDESTGVTVSGSGAAGISVTDRTDAEAVATALSGKLESFTAYDITLTNYAEGTKATVTMPAPTDADTVYYVAEDGSPEEIPGADFRTAGFVTFTTTHFSTYAAGKAVTTSGSETPAEKNWVPLPENPATGESYAQVTAIDASHTDGYLICKTKSTYYLLARSPDTAVTGRKTAREGSADACTFTDTSDDTFWYIDAGHIYCKVGDTNYYLRATYSNNNYSLGLVTSASSASVWTVKANSKNVQITTTANKKTVYLRYNSKSFDVSTSENTVALYARTPATPASSGGQAALYGTLSYTKSVGSTLTEEQIKANAAVYYRASANDKEEQVAWEDSKVTTSWDKELNTDTAGTYTMTVKYSGTEIGKIVVTVTDKAFSNPEVRGGPVIVAVNGTPDYSGITCEITYEDNTTATLSYTDLTFGACNTSSVGTRTVDVFYAGEKVGTVTVEVSDDPFLGLEEATEYPEYPADGAVRIDKTATGQDFNSTGVVKVELNAAGISVKQGVDVVLVVDVSNSMGWSVENAGGTNDAARLPTDGQQDKLSDAMDAASAFADILLGDNTASAASNNTLSFVTFAGLDTDNADTPQTVTTRKKGDSDYVSAVETYIDSVMTVFSGVESADAAKQSFSNTKFTQTDLAVNTSNKYSGSVYYYLNIANVDGEPIVSGLNRGNTNYDYAFWQASQAVAQLQGTYENYAASGRETIVVFMTDGAASHYNNYRANGVADDYKPATKTKYPGNTEYPGYDSTDVAGTWLKYMRENDNTYATKLYNATSGFYAIGFDLEHGGFSNYQWTKEELTSVLEGMVTGATLPVMAANAGSELVSFYKSLANQIKYAGTNARVTDTIGSNFTLQTTGFGTASTPSNITVTAYDLYTNADNVDNSLIGTRTGISSTLETVSFNADGTQAYSSVLGETKNIMTTEADGSVTIAAQYFTYTKDADGVETFVWNIGNITDKEVVLSFYAYLKGAMEGDRDKGVYYTNDGATIEYVDINGKYASRDFPSPAVAWGGASTSFEYYLVNHKGEPVNRAGQVVPFANRIVLYGNTVALNLNQDLTIDAQNINAAEYLPTGYYLYDVNAYYTVHTSSSTQTEGGITISEPSEDARKTVVIPGGSSVDQTGAQTTIVVSYSEGYIQSRVAFGVSWENTPISMDYELVKDQTVMDFGKAIQVNVLENDTAIPTGYTGTLVGFTVYNAKANLKQAQQSAGSAEYTTANGTYTVVDGKVNFQPEAILSSVEKVFCVVKVTKNDDVSNFYYMYEELDIIPATIMYYETDFASGVFSLTNGTNSSWITKQDNYFKSDEVQNDGTIGVNQTYGFDSTYADDALYSNGSSLKVEGEKLENGYTSASFSFTGTGFDIISRTGANQGLIQVKIYAKGAEEATKTVKVLNKSESGLELYQIPVVSVNDLDYGSYNVTIEVYPAVTYTGSLASLSYGGEFYFDALRVYDPIDVSGSVSGDAAIAKAAYTADGEADNEIIEVRQKIIDAKTFDDGSGVVDNAVVFVDRTPEGVKVADYAAIGPNNEVYLSNGQGIAFKLSATEAPASIDIGAKSADGNPVTLSASLYSMDDEYATSVKKIIASCTAQFYDLMAEASVTTSQILSGGGAYVCIFNDDDGILSITDLKVAYGEQPGTASVSVDSGASAAAAAAISAGAADPDYDIQSASFDTETCKLRKYATMTVVTSDDVKSLEVTDKKGKQVKANITSTTEGGQTTWTVSIQMTVAGQQTYTVTGYSAGGTAGAPASATINVTRK